jgi:hypothetical protein
VATHWKEDASTVHCEGVSQDYMLCGVAPEGANGGDYMEPTMAGITCPSCIRIIEFCRTIRPGEIEAPFKRRGLQR